MKPLANIPKPALVYTLLVLVLAAYAMVRVMNLSQAAQKIKQTADTASYVRISQEPLLGNKFLAGSRPFIFPLELKVFGNHVESVVWVQGILSIVSWSFLALAAASALHTPLLKVAAFALLLLLSLYRYILGWDSVLLTESLSLSFLALFLGGWFWLLRGWHWGKVVFLFLVALLWAFVRDTNAWVLLLIALFLFVLLGLRVVERRYLVLASAFLVLFFLSNVSADRGDRWVFPFQNILGRRILPRAHAIDFFAGCGMPVSPELKELAGGYANSSERAFYEDPALKEYRLWLHQSGKLCYVKWLLSDPLESVRAPLNEFDALIGLQNLQPFLFSKKFSPVLPGRLEALLFPRRGLLILFVIDWIALLVAILTKAWKHNKAWWLVIGLNLLVLPHYLITWHGDVMGIYRHVVSTSIQFYLGTWLLALLVLDSLLSLQAFQATFAKPLLKRVEQ